MWNPPQGGPKKTLNPPLNGLLLRSVRILTTGVVKKQEEVQIQTVEVRMVTVVCCFTGTIPFSVT